MKNYVELKEAVDRLLAFVRANYMTALLPIPESCAGVQVSLSALADVENAKGLFLLVNQSELPFVIKQHNAFHPVLEGDSYFNTAHWEIELLDVRYEAEVLVFYKKIQSCFNLLRLCFALQDSFCTPDFDFFALYQWAKTIATHVRSEKQMAAINPQVLAGYAERLREAQALYQQTEVDTNQALVLFKSKCNYSKLAFDEDLLELASVVSAAYHLETDPGFMRWFFNLEKPWHGFIRQCTEQLFEAQQFSYAKAGGSLMVYPTGISSLITTFCNDRDQFLEELQQQYERAQVEAKETIQQVSAQILALGSIEVRPSIAINQAFLALHKPGAGPQIRVGALVYQRGMLNCFFSRFYELPSKPTLDKDPVDKEEAIHEDSQQLPIAEVPPLLALSYDPSEAMRQKANLFWARSGSSSHQNFEQEETRLNTLE